jgi:hypothetical protein
MKTLKIGIISHLGYSATDGTMTEDDAAPYPGENATNFHGHGYRRFWEDDDASNPSVDNPSGGVISGDFRYGQARDAFNAAGVDFSTILGGYVWGDTHPDDVLEWGGKAIAISETLDNPIYNLLESRDTSALLSHKSQFFTDLGLAGGGGTHNQAPIANQYPNASEPDCYTSDSTFEFTYGIRLVFLSDTTLPPGVPTTWITDVAFDTDLPIIVFSTRYMTDRTELAESGSTGDNLIELDYLVTAGNNTWGSGANYQQSIDIKNLMINEPKVKAVIMGNTGYGRWDLENPSASYTGGAFTPYEWPSSEPKFIPLDSSILAPLPGDNRYYIIEINIDATDLDGNTFTNTKITGGGTLGPDRDKESDPMLISRWKLNEDTGETTIIDDTGNYDGTANSNDPSSFTGVVSTDGVLDTAIHFDGSTWINGTDTLIADYPFSMSAWVRVANGSGPGVKKGIFSIAPSAEDGKYIMILLNNTNIPRIECKPSGFLVGAGNGTTPIDDGEWHHVAAVFPSSNSRVLYVDGLADGTPNTINAPITNPLNLWGIGRRETVTPLVPLTGDIDDVRIYDTALSAPEVLALWNEQYYVPDTGGTDTTVHDELVLETPATLISGKQVNTKTGKYSTVSDLEIQSSVTNEFGSTTFRNTEPLTFFGDVTIDFSSRYPIKTYNSTMTDDSLINGDNAYNYQPEKAEVRYSVTGRGAKFSGKYSNIYKKPIVLKENKAGSDNIILRYKVFYKGKKSKEGKVELRIIKSNKNVFYGK